MTSSLATVVETWAARHGWGCEPSVGGDGAVYQLGVTDDRSWQWYAQAREDVRQLALFAVYDQDVPPERRVAVAELVLRASFGLTVGTFELSTACCAACPRRMPSAPSKAADAALHSRRVTLRHQYRAHWDIPSVAFATPAL